MCIATPLAIRLGKFFGILDVPGPRKIHRNVIPLTGGWPIFSTLTLVVWGHLFAALWLKGSTWEIYLGDRIQYYISIAPQLISKVGPVYIGATAIFSLGLIDDIFDISAKVRLAVQIVIAIILAALGLHPSLGFLPTWMAALVGVIWIVGITNAFNFLDGLDGLSTGVAMVGTLALLTIMGITIQPDVVFLLAALCGCQLGFLRFNYHPARIFLGSSGSLLLGYLMSISTLQVTYMNDHSTNWLIPLLTPIFVLAIPLYDTTSVVLIRLIQKRPLAIGDQSHFHHRLMKLGFSHRQTVTFIILISFAVALSAVRLVQATMFQSLVILLQIVGMLSLVIIAERVALKVRSESFSKEAPEPAQQRNGLDAKGIKPTDLPLDLPTQAERAH